MWWLFHYPLQALITVQGKILVGKKLANHEPIRQNFPRRYTENIYAICTDCCLSAKIFLANSFYLYDYPKFSPTKYFLCTGILKGGHYKYSILWKFHRFYTFCMFVKLLYESSRWHCFKRKYEGFRESLFTEVCMHNLLQNFSALKLSWYTVESYEVDE